MIDVEPQVYSKVATALRTAHPGINVIGTLEFAPSSFPAVCFEESDNYGYSESADTSSSENHVVVTYDANIFSNAITGCKAEVKAILSTIDSTMNALGFRKITQMPMKQENGIKCRYLARYQAVVGSDQKIYRR